MAATVAVKRTYAASNGKIVTGTVTMDSSYLTGGELVTPADFGLNGIDHVIVGNPPLGGFVASYAAATGAIKLWYSTTGAPNILVEVTSGVSAATAVVPVVVFGN